eukprot:4643528-Pleurochrysis_carterae.AAC.1
MADLLAGPHDAVRAGGELEADVEHQAPWPCSPPPSPPEAGIRQTADASASSTLQKAPEMDAAATAKAARAAERKALMPFAVISISYLLFTVTDGAIRMI